MHSLIFEKYAQNRKCLTKHFQNAEVILLKLVNIYSLTNMALGLVNKTSNYKGNLQKKVKNKSEVV